MTLWSLVRISEADQTGLGVYQLRRDGHVRGHLVVDDAGAAAVRAALRIAEAALDRTADVARAGAV